VVWAAQWGVVVWGCVGWAVALERTRAAIVPWFHDVCGSGMLPVCPATLFPCTGRRAAPAPAPQPFLPWQSPALLHCTSPPRCTAPQDVVSFLSWAAEPEADERKLMGTKWMAVMALVSTCGCGSRVTICGAQTGPSALAPRLSGSPGSHRC
jgi:hypothetical protein